MAKRKYPEAGPLGYLMKEGKIPARRSCLLSCRICLEFLGRSAMIGPGVSMGENFEPRSAFRTYMKFAANRFRKLRSVFNSLIACNAALASGNGNGVLPTKS